MTATGCHWHMYPYVHCEIPDLDASNLKFDAQITISDHMLMSGLMIAHALKSTTLR